MSTTSLWKGFGIKQDLLYVHFDGGGLGVWVKLSEPDFCLIAGKTVLWWDSNEESEEKRQFM